MDLKAVDRGDESFANLIEELHLLAERRQTIPGFFDKGAIRAGCYLKLRLHAALHLASLCAYGNCSSCRVISSWSGGTIRFPVSSRNPSKHSWRSAFNPAERSCGMTPPSCSRTTDGTISV